MIAWRDRRLAAAMVVAALVLLAPRPARALINPRFTPADLVGQSDMIVELGLGPAAKDGSVALSLVRALKGKAPATLPPLDTARTPFREHAELLRETVGPHGGTGVLFAGSYDEPPPGEGGPSIAVLHVGGRWFRVVRRADGPWLLDVVDDYMQTCWAGSSEMLLRAVAYVLEDPAAEFPVKVGVQWAARHKVGHVDGPVHAAALVDLEGKGERLLFIASEAGDRLFAVGPEASSARDVTAEQGLASRSRAAAWGDFDGDGRLDLASWDGRALRFHLKKAAAVAMPLEEKVTGLAAVGDRAAKRSALVGSRSDGAPLLVRLGEDGKPVGGSLPAPQKLPQGQTAHPCLVADFDADGLADVLQPLAEGAWFWRGKAGGGFEAPRPAGEVGTGPGRAAAFTGDFDHDGLLDVLVAGEEGCRLWHNRGDGRFEEAFQDAGEAAYISKPSATGGMTGDVNNDGRQDFLVLYADRPPQIFFNRGFATFGHARELDLELGDFLPESAGGQQAGLLGDLDGDGAQDMAVVLKGGDVWFFRRDLGPRPLAARARLPSAQAAESPVNVTGWEGTRCLGAWNVTAGTDEAFFGRPNPGPVRLAWRLGPRPPCEKQVVLLDRPVEVPLRP